MVMIHTKNRKESALIRHIKMVHKTEPAVIKVLALPRRDQIEVFNKLRKEGIFEHNKKEMRGGGGITPTCGRGETSSVTNS